MSRLTSLTHTRVGLCRDCQTGVTRRPPLNMRPHAAAARQTLPGSSASEELPCALTGGQKVLSAGGGFMQGGVRQAGGSPQSAGSDHESGQLRAEGQSYELAGSASGPAVHCRIHRKSRHQEPGEAHGCTGRAAQLLKAGFKPSYRLEACRAVHACHRGEAQLKAAARA